jgi:hypothetical protein
VAQCLLNSQSINQQIKGSLKNHIVSEMIEKKYLAS